MAEPNIVDVVIEQAELRGTIIETNKAVGRIEKSINSFVEIQYDMNTRLSAIEAQFDRTLRDRVSRMEEILRPISKIWYAIILLIVSGFIGALLALVIN